MSAHYRERADYDGRAGCGCAALLVLALAVATVVLWEVAKSVAAFLAAMIVAGA